MKRLNKGFAGCCVVVSFLFASKPSYTEAKPRAKITAGIYGWSIQQGFSAEAGFFTAYDYDLVIKNANGTKVIKRVRTTNNGNFTVTLAPGRYVVVPQPGRNINASSPSISVGNDNHSQGFFTKQAKVRVWKGSYTPVYVTFEF